MGLVCCLLEVVLTFYVSPVDQGLVYFAKRNGETKCCSLGNENLQLRNENLLYAK